MLCYVVGSMYMHQCPAETFVPIYLVVLGVSLVIMFPMWLLVAGENAENPEGESNTITSLLLKALGFFQIAWLIAGEFTPNHYYNQTCHMILNSRIRYGFWRFLSDTAIPHFDTDVI